MFGYATNETDCYMPFAILMAHNLSKKLSEVRKTKEIGCLRPDGKTQVTVEYENDKPKRIETILISNQYKKGTDVNVMKKDIIEKIKDRFDLMPQGIINYLELQKPIYRQTTNYGHFGKEGLCWERIIEL